MPKTRYRLLVKGWGEVPKDVVAKYGLTRHSRLVSLGIPGVLHDPDGKYVCQVRLDVTANPPTLAWELYEILRMDEEKKPKSSADRP